MSTNIIEKDLLNECEIFCWKCIDVELAYTMTAVRQWTAKHKTTVFFSTEQNTFANNNNNKIKTFKKQTDNNLLFCSRWQYTQNR